jgi:hypothetical protein
MSRRHGFTTLCQQCGESVVITAKTGWHCECGIGYCPHCEACVLDGCSHLVALAMEDSWFVNPFTSPLPQLPRIYADVEFRPRELGFAFGDFTDAIVETYGESAWGFAGPLDHALQCQLFREIARRLPSLIEEAVWTSGACGCASSGTDYYSPQPEDARRAITLQVRRLEEGFDRLATIAGARARRVQR